MSYIEVKTLASPIHQLCWSVESLTSAVVSVRRAGAIVTTWTGGQTHTGLFHAVPLQEDEEPRLAGQAAVVLRTRQAPALTPRAHALCGRQVQML